MVHGDRSVDVFVRKLRQKLERVSPRWRYIHTHFGIGYRFAAEAIDAVEEQVTVPVTVGPVSGDVPAEAAIVPAEAHVGV